MTWQRMFGVPVGLLLLCGTVHASKRVPPATMQDLGTAWVGGTASSGEFVRLDLNSEGKGTLVIRYLASHPVRGYRITRTVLTGYTVNFHLEPIDSDAEPIRVGGRTHPMYLNLEVAGVERQWKRSLRVERLSDLANALDAVSKRVNELGNEVTGGGA